MRAFFASYIAVIVGLASACGPSPSPAAPPAATPPNTTPPATSTATPPSAAPPPAHACTEMGCMDGLRLTLEPSSRWPAGAYRFELVIDGATTSCTGSLPLPSCASGAALTCTGAPVQIGESGCALPAAEHGFSEISLASAATQVKVSITRNGKPVGEREFHPTYRRLQPNGPDCPPICNSASDSWRVF